MNKRLKAGLLALMIAVQACAMSVCYAASETDEAGVVKQMAEMTEEEAIEVYGYYLIDEDESGTVSTGDQISFGSYPQSRVENEDLLARLAEEEGEPGGDGWTSYSYYANGGKSDYMWYKDVTVDEVTYRGVYMTAYRATDSQQEASTEEEESGGPHETGLELGTVIWYEYEPLLWTVLSNDEESGAAYVMSLSIIDGQPYQDVYTADGTDPETGSALNDWADSSMREFLNETFYNLAFDENEQAMILEAALDNAGTCMKTSWGEGLEETTDYVFLASWEDVINEEYGFCETMDFHLQGQVGVENLNDTSLEIVVQAMARRRGVTDYSISQGCGFSVTCISSLGQYASTYALRSAGQDARSISYVDKYGGAIYTSTSGTYAYNIAGVVPAMYLSIES